MQPIVPKRTVDLEEQLSSSSEKNQANASLAFNHLSRVAPQPSILPGINHRIRHAPLLTMRIAPQSRWSSNSGVQPVSAPMRRAELSATTQKALSHDVSGQERDFTLITRWAEGAVFNDEVNLKYANSMHDSAVHFCEKLANNSETLSFKHLWRDSLTARRDAASTSKQALHGDYFVKIGTTGSARTPLNGRYFYILEKLKPLILEKVDNNFISNKSYRETGSLMLSFSSSYLLAFNKANIPVSSSTLFENINDCVHYLELMDPMSFKGVNQLFSQIILKLKTNEPFAEALIHRCVDDHFAFLCQGDSGYANHLSQMTPPDKIQNQMKAFFTRVLTPSIKTFPPTRDFFSSVKLKCDKFCHEKDLSRACALALSVYHDMVRFAPVVRGTAARAHWMLHTMLLSKGLLLPPAKPHIAPDLEAMTEPHDVFVARALDEIFVSDSDRKVFDHLESSNKNRLDPSFLEAEGLHYNEQYTLGIGEPDEQPSRRATTDDGGDEPPMLPLRRGGGHHRPREMHEANDQAPRMPGRRT